jgi:hypothetical protein
MEMLRGKFRSWFRFRTGFPRLHKAARLPVVCMPTLQRTYTENSKQIFPEKELRGHSTNFHIHVSVNVLYIPTINLSIMLQENMWTDPWNI